MKSILGIGCLWDRVFMVVALGVTVQGRVVGWGSGLGRPFFILVGVWGLTERVLASILWRKAVSSLPVQRTRGLEQKSGRAYHPRRRAYPSRRTFRRSSSVYVADVVVILASSSHVPGCREIIGDIGRSGVPGNCSRGVLVPLWPVRFSSSGAGSEFDPT